MIPVVWAKIAAAAGVAGLAAGVLIGATGATWRADAACAERVQGVTDQVTTLTDQNHKLELKIAESNKAVAVAAAQTEVAKVAQKQAEQHAATLAKFSQSRVDKLNADLATAKGCDDIMRRYWEMRK